MGEGMASEDNKTLKTLTPLYQTLAAFGNGLGIAKSDLHSRIMQFASLKPKNLNKNITAIFGEMANKAQQLNKAYIWQDLQKFLGELAKLNQQVANDLIRINQMDDNAKRIALCELLMSDRIRSLFAEQLKQYASLSNKSDKTKEAAINSIFEQNANAAIQDMKTASQQTIYQPHTWFVRGIFKLFFQCMDAMLIEADLLPPSFADNNDDATTRPNFVPMP